MRLKTDEGGRYEIRGEGIVGLRTWLADHAKPLNETAKRESVRFRTPEPPADPPAEGGGDSDDA